MRFGIPSDFYEETVAIQPQHEPSSLLPAVPLDLASSPSPIDIFESTLRQFQQLQLGAEKQKIERLNKAKQAQKETYQSELKALTNLVNGAFSSLIKDEGEEVAKIINKHRELQRLEEERRRKEQEERQIQQRLKEEQKRKRKEEETKRQKEEEARRKAEEEARKKKELEEKKKREEEDLKRTEEEKQKKLKEEQEKAKNAKGFTDALLVKQEVEDYRKQIADIKENVVKQVSQNLQLKKDLAAVKRKVNVKFGQLSNSVSQVFQVCQDVIALIQPVKSNKLAYDWILNFISKAVVAQAEAEVTVKPAAALPLGRLTLFLLEHLEGLEYFLCARFVKKCCFVVGYTGNIDTEEGRVRMGWKRANEKWEDEVKYEERVGGIFTVWSVISTLNQSNNFTFFSMNHHWQVLARLLNTDKDLLRNVNYVIAANWWESAGQQFYGTYKKQAVKLMNLLVGPWAQFGKEKSFPAATRLQILGEDALKNGQWNQLKPMES